MALRKARQHRAWKERWPCHVDGAVYIVSLHIASYVYFVPVLYTAVAAGIRYQIFFSGTCIRARARVPSPGPLRSSVGPELEPSSLDSEMDDTLSLAELPRAPEHASMSLGCIAFTGTYSRGIPGTYVYIGVYRCNIKSSSARIVF